MSNSFLARKELLTTQASLLGVSPETFAANIQYLHSHGIDHVSGMLLGTKVRTKRRKLAWMLRELFDYRSVPTDQRRNGGIASMGRSFESTVPKVK